jgi:hypothetical protein
VLERADGRHEAINACIALLGQMDGHAIRTVEGLLGKDDTPHPVQQVMAESDATQCGFCTPGFVMSAYAFASGGEPPELDAIHGRAGRQPLPLHRLPADRRRDEEGRGSRSGNRGTAACAHRLRRVRRRLPRAALAR